MSRSKELGNAPGLLPFGALCRALFFVHKNRAGGQMSGNEKEKCIHWDWKQKRMQNKRRLRQTV
jgi:hypothetical protein